MRDYAKVSSQFWTGETGKAIRAAGLEVRVVATYLLTCSSANMLGLYYLPLPLLSYETGIPIKGASKALRSLRDIGFADYCERSEQVWVPEMARFQIGETLDLRDKRRLGVIKELQMSRKSPFVFQFLQKYRDPYSLPEMALDSPYEAPCKPLDSPSDGVIPPHTPPIEQEQEQEHAANEGASESLHETKLKLKSGGDYRAPLALVQKLKGAYQQVDVDAEMIRMAIWLETNPAKRKARQGMPAFMNNWLSRAKGMAAPRPSASLDDLPDAREEIRRQHAAGW